MGILKLKPANCKNCYKCVRGCPVKAIEVKDHQAQILEQECILCGKCTLICPQSAKSVRGDVPAVRALLRQGKRVIASVAPSYISNFPVSGFAEFSSLLLALGFSEARETAEGAYLVKSEYEALVERGWQKVVISSCCPTVNALIQKHYPRALPFLAPVVSPMQAHAKLIKREQRDAFVVFIGPCISKKGECESSLGGADAALTFEELEEWMALENLSVPVQNLPGEPRLSRFFPVSGGILSTMRKNPSYQYLAVDGIQNCMAALEEISAGCLPNTFVEMSACPGSCIGGPAARRATATGSRPRCAWRKRPPATPSPSRRTPRTSSWRGESLPARRVRLPIRPPARALRGGDRLHPSEDGQDQAGGRTQLRHLRLRHLPG